MTFSIKAAFGAGVSAGYKAAVNAAIAYFTTTFNPEHPVYLNIKFDWGPLGPGAVAQSSTAVNACPFANVVAALPQVDKDIPADKGLELPDSNPFGGSMNATNSQEAAMGLFSPDGSTHTSSDATVTLNSNLAYSFDPSQGVKPSQFDAVGVLEHEVSEVMGRQCGGSSPGSLFPEPFALFRYDASGTIDTTNGINDYFALNDKGSFIHSHMGEPNGNDLADWNSLTDDCVGFAGQGRVQTFSAADVRVMEALGWRTGGGAAVTTLAPVDGTSSFALSPVLATAYDFAA